MGPVATVIQRFGVGLTLNAHFHILRGTFLYMHRMTLHLF
jgi:hypothetical protein